MKVTTESGQVLDVEQTPNGWRVVEPPPATDWLTAALGRLTHLEHQAVDEDRQILAQEAAAVAQAIKDRDSAREKKKKWEDDQACLRAHPNQGDLAGVLLFLRTIGGNDPSPTLAAQIVAIEEAIELKAKDGVRDQEQLALLNRAGKAEIELAAACERITELRALWRAAVAALESRPAEETKP